MGYFLIVIGIVSIVGGIVILTHREDQPTQTVQYRELKEVKTIHDTITKTEVKTVVIPTAIPSATPTAEIETATKDTPTKPTNSDSDKTTSKAKGDLFEDFVVNLLADWRLKLLDRTQDKISTAGVVAESCKNPDLHIQQKFGKSQIDYYLECKYRSDWKDGAITFDSWQLDRYRKLQSEKRRKVIIALGVGGTSDNPQTFRLVPIDSIRGNSIPKIKTEFAIEPTSSALVEYMNNYFNTVFKKSNQRKKKAEKSND